MRDNARGIYEQKTAQGKLLECDEENDERKCGISGTSKE